MINSIYTCLFNIDKSLRQAFSGVLNSELVQDNFVQIMLMIDQYLLNGVPCFNETNVLAGLVCPYGVTDKITEKLIGKAKEYETKTLSNYIRESQSTYDGYKYNDENIEGSYQVLFDFIDYLDVSCDRYVFIYKLRLFNILSKVCHSDIEITSQVLSNIELNILLNIPFNVIDFTLDDAVITK
jgi:hypothetical protein